MKSTIEVEQFAGLGRATHERSQRFEQAGWLRQVGLISVGLISLTLCGLGDQCQLSQCD